MTTAAARLTGRVNPYMSRKTSHVLTAPATITAERVETSLRSRFDPLPSLSPRRLVQYLQQFDYGYLDLAARTWDAMERRDDRLASVSAKAKSALARYGFEVRQRPNLPLALREEAARHQAALEHLYTHCTVTNAVREDETGGFSLLVRQMADAIGKRYSVHEIVWEPGADGQLTATFRHAPLWFFEATTGRLRYKLQDGAATGVPMDPDAWLVTVGDGIMEACSVLWIYKHLPLRDWLAFSEKFGMPYLLGKTQAIFNSAEWQAMAAALRGFGHDGAAVVGGADDIVPVPMGAGSETTPFPGLVERSERAMSILWRGADLGTQAHSGTGQGQGASLQADETQALDEDRAAWLTESLAAVSRTAIRYLFGEGVPPLAYVRLRTEVKRDIQLDLAVDAFLLSNGAPVGVADVLARYGRPTPGADEPLLRPPPAAGGGDGGGGAKGAASEDATRASIERAANGAEAARVAAGNFNPNHDKLGRFTTAAGAGGAGGKAVPKPGAPGSPAAGKDGAKPGDPGWGLYHPDIFDKVYGFFSPAYKEAKREEASLKAQLGMQSLSPGALNSMRAQATDAYMRAQEQLGDLYNDPAARKALEDRYVAQMNGAIDLQADVAKTERTIAQPAIDAIEMMTMAGVAAGLASLDGPALSIGQRSVPEPEPFTSDGEMGNPSPDVVPKTLEPPAEPVPSSASPASATPQPRSLTDIQARDWYNGKLAEIDDLEAQMRADGKSDEEIFWEVSSLRNTLKMQARDLMQDQNLAESLPPPTPPEEVLKKYDGDYAAAIAASKRSNVSVNQGIEDRRASGEK